MSTPSKLSSSPDSGGVGSTDVAEPEFMYAYGFSVSDRGVSIDVGEKELYFASCADVARYQPVNKNPNSLVLKVTYPSKRVECMVVKWCSKHLYTPDRSFVASEAVDDKVRVPANYGLTVGEFHDTVVEVLFREYIEGTTAANAWPSLSVESRHKVMCQVSEICSNIHQLTAPYHGHVTGNPLMSKDASDYISRTVVRAKMLNHLDRLWELGGRCESADKPTLCHNSLGPDHVILQGDVVVGVIGWGRADFGPPAIEKYWYCFSQCQDDWYEWYCHLSSAVPCKDLPTSGFAKVCIRLIYTLAWNNWSSQLRPALSRIHHALDTDSLWSAKKRESDQQSLPAPYSPRHADALHLSAPSVVATSISSFDFDAATELSSDDGTIPATVKQG